MFSAGAFCIDRVEPSPYLEFLASHGSVGIHLDSMDDRILELEANKSSVSFSVWQDMYPIIRATDEFFHHCVSSREGMLQEVNFVFGPRIAWKQQGLRFEDKVRDQNKHWPFWRHVETIKAEPWWQRVIGFRNHFTHRAAEGTLSKLPAGLEARPSLVSKEGDFYLHEDLVGEKSETRYALVEDLSRIRNKLHEYFTTVYLAMTQDLASLNG